jgi:hypothetical protein
MNVHDDAWQDDIALLALGVLPESEARTLAAHIASCAECRALYRDLRGAADLVGYGAEAPPGDIDELAAARLKSRVMGAVRADAATASATASARRAEPALAERAATPWYASLAVAAAIALALLTGVDDLSLRSQRGEYRDRIADLQKRAATQAWQAAAARAQAHELATRLAEVTAPGSKHFDVPGGEVVTSGGHVFIALRDAPAPPAGKVYQAWTLAKGASTVAPSVTFSPAANGVTLIELPQSSAGLAAVAVSIEPAGGSKAPTSKPAFVRKLS